MWTEAIVYSAISLALAYAGWHSEPGQLQEVSASATNGEIQQGPSAAEQPHSASR